MQSFRQLSMIKFSKILEACSSLFVLFWFCNYVLKPGVHTPCKVYIHGQVFFRRSFLPSTRRKWGLRAIHHRTSVCLALWKMFCYTFLFLLLCIPLIMQCAKEIYFKEWDAQRYSFPDSRSAVLKLFFESMWTLYLYNFLFQQYWQTQRIH